MTALFLSARLFGQEVSVRSLIFDKNSYQLKQEHFVILDEIGKKCSSAEFSFLKIFGYSDTSGVVKYNETLSRLRAEAVEKYLKRKFKFDVSKIYVTWLGEETDGYYDLHFKEANIQKRYVDILVYLKHTD